jgi:phosphoglycolate phosphatase-like HAD superfamily hydrolase
MIGDSVYDCEAASNAGVETIAVLTGGFSDSELLKSGARIVFASIVELRECLAWTPLG